MSTAGLQLPLPDVRSAQGSEIPLKSAPQGRLRPFDLVRGADAWLPSDFPSPEVYTTRLTPQDVRELDAAVKVVVAAAWPSSSSSAASSSSFAEEGANGGGGGGGNGGDENGNQNETSNQSSSNTSSLLHKLYTTPEQARALLPTLAPKLEAMRRACVPAPLFSDGSGDDGGGGENGNGGNGESGNGDNGAGENKSGGNGGNGGNGSGGGREKESGKTEGGETESESGGDGKSGNGEKESRGKKGAAPAPPPSLGRGFALLSGFPVERYTRRETLAGYWLFGLLWGKACSNNKKGHMVGHVKDIGHDPALPDTRLYATSAAQPWHNDASDLVSLLCLKNAREGGLSSWASSSSVYNSVLRSHPHLARVLAGPWYMDRKGEVPEGKQPFFEIPVFNFHQGYLRVNISENYYLLSQRHTQVPRLTPDHYEALRVFNAYAELLKIAYLLQPGDIQLLSNHTCLHHRAAFLDGPKGEERHLLRLWLAPADEKELPPAYEEIYGGRGLVMGNRGGIHVCDTVECVPEEAE